MHLLEVGKLYVPGITRWPEATEYLFGVNGHELRLFYNSPSQEEITGVRAGACEFALYVQSPLLVFCHKFAPATQFFDCPFTPWRVPETHRAFPDPAELTPETRALLNVALVDARTGILKALRAVSLSVGFTALLYEALKEQGNVPTTLEDFDSQMRLLQRRYSADDLAQIAQARCRGGA